MEAEIARLRKENADLRARLARYEPDAAHKNVAPSPSPSFTCNHNLTPREISRYGRHLILPDAGPLAQERWCRGSVLVIGAGGLGAPVCMYLAANGVGHITIIDDDIVDESNLHRQVIHSEATVGMPKAESARAACLRLNSGITVTALVGRFLPENGLALGRAHDVIVDASDNVATRYLASDVAVLAGKPLVSGAALRTDGQLSVYAAGADCPCYRCLFRSPPPSSTVMSCSDGGVLGPVPGVIGTMQAVEALKLLARGPNQPRTTAASASVSSGNAVASLQPSLLCAGSTPPPEPSLGRPLARSLLLYDAAAGRVRMAALRGRDPACPACGESPVLTEEVLRRGDLPGLALPVCADTLAAAARNASPEKTACAGQEAPALDPGSDADEQEDRPARDESNTATPASVPATAAAPAPVRGYSSLPPADAWSLISSGRALLLDVRAPVQRSIGGIRAPARVPRALTNTPGAECTGASSVNATDSDADGSDFSSAGAAGIEWSALRSPQGAAALRLALQRFRDSQPAAAPTDSSAPAATVAHPAADASSSPPVDVVVVCRRGVFSRFASEELSTWPEVRSGEVRVTNLRGGIEAFARDVDPTFPTY